MLPTRSSRPSTTSSATRTTHRHRCSSTSSPPASSGARPSAASTHTETMGLEAFSLEGKAAIVTGASRGIGAAIATAFAEAGADVALAARSTSDIEQLAGKIESLGRRAIAITTDVTDPDDVRACVAKTLDGFGKIDTLVNNAGGTRFMAPLIDLRPDGWHKAIALNLDSVFMFCQEAGRHMVGRGSGSVINMSSVAGVHGAPALSYSSAATDAVVGLTKP